LRQTLSVALALTAPDGAAALEKARREKPAFIILDLVLPKMPGLEVCKILKSDRGTRHVPIVMHTAKAEEIDRIVGLEFGADDYVKSRSNTPTRNWAAANFVSHVVFVTTVRFVLSDAAALSEDQKPETARCLPRELHSSGAHQFTVVRADKLRLA
jgi:CheY-like chemotaxis protein